MSNAIDQSMHVTISQAKQLLVTAINAKLVPILYGAPGLGKSDIIRQIAVDRNLKVIDLRLSQCDPTDLMGFPSINKETGKASYLPMEMFPVEGDEVPKGYSGWLLFLDEFTSAPKAVQAAAYKVVLDGQVGQLNLHEDVTTVCAGNLAHHGAIASPMGTAMKSRLVHLELKVDKLDFMKWCSTQAIDFRIPAFIEYSTGSLMTFNAQTTDHTFACPRTWEFTNRLLGVEQNVTSANLSLFAGTIGPGTAMKFKIFCDIFQSLPTIQEILANPQSFKIPDDKMTQYAITGAIGSNMDDTNLDKLMVALKRMPIEFQVIGLRDACVRNPALVKQKVVSNWVSSFGNAMYR